jgi:hypothetical protein
MPETSRSGTSTTRPAFSRFFEFVLLAMDEIEPLRLPPRELRRTGCADE